MRLKKVMAVFMLSTIFLTACQNEDTGESYYRPSKAESAADQTASKESESVPAKSLEMSSAASDVSQESEEMAGEESASALESTERPTAAADATAADGTVLPIQAQSAVVYDCSTKTIIASKNERNAVYPASTVKLMAALVAAENVPLETVITVGDELDLVEPGSSLAGLKRGDQLTMNDLLHALLIPSGNDASYTIAAYTGRVLAENPELSAADAVEIFMDKMNARAEELEMRHTTFTNPDGIDAEDQKTTAADMTVLAAEIVAHPELTAITRLYEYTTTSVGGMVYDWINTNELLNPEHSDYLSTCIGLKTGSTESSGYCIISAVERDGKTAVSVVMNGAREGRWDDSRTLYNYWETLQ